MKKILLAMMAAFLMSGVAMAQQTQERKQLSETEMIKHRTDRMVKQYNLDEGQAARLLELNTQFASKLPGRGMRPRNGKGPRPADMQKPADKKTDPVAKKENGKKAQRPDFVQMKKNMEAYEAQLKTILSAEQFKAYQADMEKMRQRGPRQHRNTPEQ